MGQSSPVSDSRNLIQLTLQSNVNLPFGSRITLLGARPSWIVGVPVLAGVEIDGSESSQQMANLTQWRQGIVFTILWQLSAGTLFNFKFLN